MIASLNGTNIGGWIRYAQLVERRRRRRGRAEPLHDRRRPRASTRTTIEADQLELVALLVEELDIPVAVKISPYYSSLAAFPVGLQDAGASGIVMFNRFYSPDLDLETLEVMPRIALSTPTELRLPLRWVGHPSRAPDHLDRAVPPASTPASTRPS